MRNALAINQVLNEFHSWAGIGINKAKCSLSFSATSYRVKRKIIRTLGFREVQLPLKYWGLPRGSTRLRHSDCLPLLDKFNRRRRNWKGRLQSYAGRMELISSVLASLHIYWSSAFRLPEKIFKSISLSIRDFFWSGPETTMSPMFLKLYKELPLCEGRAYNTGCLHYGQIHDQIWKLF